MRQTVVILGGGIGGLSTAHELADRGFEGADGMKDRVRMGEPVAAVVPQVELDRLGTRKD